MQAWFLKLPPLGKLALGVGGATVLELLYGAQEGRRWFVSAVFSAWMFYILGRLIAFRLLGMRGRVGLVATVLPVDRQAFDALGGYKQLLVHFAGPLFQLMAALVAFGFLWDGEGNQTVIIVCKVLAVFSAFYLLPFGLVDGGTFSQMVKRHGRVLRQRIAAGLAIWFLVTGIGMGIMGYFPFAHAMLALYWLWDVDEGAAQLPACAQRPDPILTTPQLQKAVVAYALLAGTAAFVLDRVLFLTP